MFGYVLADGAAMSDEQRQRYRACYCGLCQCIGDTYGTLQRAALNYDMTFLVLLLSALYEPEETNRTVRCMAHPLKPHLQWQSFYTSYAAAMNVALAYYNSLDDWQDDRKLHACCLAGLFRRSMDQIRRDYPRQCAAIEACLQTLQQIEAADLQDPDAGANAFGQLMGQLFVFHTDRWEPQLRKIGQSLGKYIYLLDAIIDLPEDLKRGSYNPFRSRSQQGVSKESLLPVLKSYMGECAEAFEQLPLLQDLDLLRNILYSGIWSRYYQNDRKFGKEASNV